MASFGNFPTCILYIPRSSCPFRFGMGSFRNLRICVICEICGSSSRRLSLSPQHPFSLSPGHWVRFANSCAFASIRGWNDFIHFFHISTARRPFVAMRGATFTAEKVSETRVACQVKNSNKSKLVLGMARCAVHLFLVSVRGHRLHRFRRTPNSKLASDAELARRAQSPKLRTRNPNPRFAPNFEL